MILKKDENKIETVSFLKKIMILQNLTEDQLEKFAQICQYMEVNANTAIMKEGEIGNTMYLFIEGEVEFSNAATLKIPKKGFEKLSRAFKKKRFQ